MSVETYWGEIPDVADTESGIAALEREQITKPKPMEVEGPLLYQPSSRHYPPTNEALPGEHFAMDPVVIHTIRVIQHIKKLKNAIAALQLDIKPDTDSIVTPVGPVPEYDGPPIKDRSKQTFFTESEYETDFVRGVGKPPPSIDEFACRKLLRRSTAAVCAHLSFDTTHESVLETLTDLCQEFILQFTRHLGIAADRRATIGSDGFPDIVERVFHEMGMGSMTTLHDFYQQRVLVYHGRMIQQCNALMAEYSTLIKKPLTSKNSPTSPSTGDTLHVIRIKEEPSTEIQFPLLDENDEVNDAEQLLNIESLGPFEITVEHETATGLTTDVETNWSQAGKSSTTESRSKNSVSGEDAVDTPGSQEAVIAQTPQSNVPCTPQSNVPHTPSEASAPTPRDSSTNDETIQEPGSISSMDIFSPSISTPSKPKKKKKN